MILHVAPNILVFGERINNGRKQKSKNRTFGWPSPITDAAIWNSRLGHRHISAGNFNRFLIRCDACVTPKETAFFTVTQISYLSHAFIRNNICELAYNFMRKWEQLVFAIRDQRSIAHFSIGSVSHSTFLLMKDRNDTRAVARVRPDSWCNWELPRVSLFPRAMYIFLFCSMR